LKALALRHRDDTWPEGAPYFLARVALLGIAEASTSSLGGTLLVAARVFRIGTGTATGGGAERALLEAVGAVRRDPAVVFVDFFTAACAVGSDTASASVLLLTAAVRETPAAAVRVRVFGFAGSRLPALSLGCGTAERVAKGLAVVVRVAAGVRVARRTGLISSGSGSGTVISSRGSASPSSSATNSVGALETVAFARVVLAAADLGAAFEVPPDRDSSSGSAVAVLARVARAVGALLVWD
jgi:hypothetical protein